MNKHHRQNKHQKRPNANPTPKASGNVGAALAPHTSAIQIPKPNGPPTVSVGQLANAEMTGEPEHRCHVLWPREGLSFHDGRSWFGHSGNLHANALDFPLGPSLLAAWRSSREKWYNPSHEPKEDAQRDPSKSKLFLVAALPMIRELGKSVSGKPQLLFPRPKDHLMFEPKPPYKGGVVCYDAAEKLENVEEKRHIHLYDGLQSEGDAVLGNAQTQKLDSYIHLVATDRKEVSSPNPWWDEERFYNWLHTPKSRCWIEKKSDYSFRMQKRKDVHTAIDPATGSALDGFLYATEIVEPVLQIATSTQSKILDLREVGVALLERAPTINGEKIAQLGSRGRLAAVEESAVSFPKMPEQLLQLVGQKRCRLITITPSYFGSDLADDKQKILSNYFGKGNRNAKANQIKTGIAWRPEGRISKDGRVEFDLTYKKDQSRAYTVSVCLCAALVDRPIPLAGWDTVSQQPKKSILLVPAGSVYYIEKRDGNFTEEEIRGLWFAQWGHGQQAGFGCVVPGLWDGKSHG